VIQNYRNITSTESTEYNLQEVYRVRTIQKMVTSNKRNLKIRLKWKMSWKSYSWSTMLPLHKEFHGRGPLLSTLWDLSMLVQGLSEK